MVERIAWTLIHFVWEGTAIAAVLSLLLWATRRGAASLRYGLACVGLVLLVACPIVTFLQLTTVHSAVPDAISVAPKGSHFTMGETIVPESSVFPLVVQLWAVGVALLSVRFVGTLVHVERWKRRHTRPAAAEWQERVDVLARRMGISRGIRVLVSEKIGVPSAWGIFKSVVVLPASMLAQLSPAQVETILLHELAHIRRHDYLVNLLQTVVETALFYHPAVWWISSVVRREREHCCDDVVVNSLADPMPYARALLHLEERRAMLPRPTLSAKGSNLMNRIARILGAKPAPIRISPLASTMAALGVFAAVMGGTLEAQAQSPKPAAPPKVIKAKAKAKKGVKAPGVSVSVRMVAKPAPAPKSVVAPKAVAAPKPVPAIAPALPAKPARAAIPAHPALPPKPAMAIKLAPVAKPAPPRVVPAQSLPKDPMRRINMPFIVAPQTRVAAMTPAKFQEAMSIQPSASAPAVELIAQKGSSITLSSQPATLTPGSLMVVKAALGTLNRVQSSLQDQSLQLAPATALDVKTVYGSLVDAQNVLRYQTARSLYGTAKTVPGLTHYQAAKTLYGKAYTARPDIYTSSVFGKTPGGQVKVWSTKPFATFSDKGPFMTGKTFFNTKGGFDTFAAAKSGKSTWNAQTKGLFGAQKSLGLNFTTSDTFFGDGVISIDVKGNQVSLDVKDARLAATLRKLAKQSKLSVVIAPGRYDNVTLVLSEVTPSKAIEIICRAAGAAYRSEGGVYYISPRSGVIAPTAGR